MRFQFNRNTKPKCCLLLYSGLWGSGSLAGQCFRILQTLKNQESGQSRLSRGSDRKQVKRTCEGSSRPRGGRFAEAGASSRRRATALAPGPHSDFHPTSPRDLSAPASAHALAQARGRSPGGAPAKDENMWITFLQSRRPVFCRGPDWGVLRKDFQNP